MAAATTRRGSECAAGVRTNFGRRLTAASIWTYVMLLAASQESAAIRSQLGTQRKNNALHGGIFPHCQSCRAGDRTSNVVRQVCCGSQSKLPAKMDAGSNRGRTSARLVRRLCWWNSAYTGQDRRLLWRPETIVTKTAKQFDASCSARACAQRSIASTALFGLGRSQLSALCQAARLPAVAADVRGQRRRQADLI